MKIFKWRLISEEEYQAGVTARVVASKLSNVHRWFSGWKDLDIIWDYVFPTDFYFGSIDSCRDRYASARGTTVYGEVKK